MSMLNELSTPLQMATTPMSMLSKLFTTASNATAARAVSTAANELGVAKSVGLGSGTGTLASTRIGGTGAPAISAGMGRATSVGALSVPCAWTGAAPSAPLAERRCTSAAPLLCRRRRRVRALGYAADDAGRQHGRTSGCCGTDSI